ncbi:MAG: hypothetical protein L3K26_06385 [Candidatus Hydrogenedentes bacterium]|nr:hypothetical protein [Candidatus Hydrogenedentota bacterium]
MASLDQAVCVYHPGKAATSKCKQCGQTTCHQCTITGPTGKFCSTPCRSANEARVIQAGGIEEKRRSTLFVKLRGIIAKLLVLLAVLAAAIWVTNFIYIPGLSELAIKILEITGF